MEAVEEGKVSRKCRSQNKELNYNVEKLMQSCIDKAKTAKKNETEIKKKVEKKQEEDKKIDENFFDPKNPYEKIIISANQVDEDI